MFRKYVLQNSVINWIWEVRMRNVSRMAPGFPPGTTEWGTVPFTDMEYMKIELCG